VRAAARLQPCRACDARRWPDARGGLTHAARRTERRRAARSWWQMWRSSRQKLRARRSECAWAGGTWTRAGAGLALLQKCAFHDASFLPTARLRLTS
jgi:hypothetical protein